MAPRVVHTKVSGRTYSGTDSARVGGQHWDADHTITGLTIGTDVQAHDATLDALSGKSTTGSGNIVLSTSPAFTTPTGIVKGDIGLGNVDNTSDANKPVSTAQQTALNLKANLANPAFTGSPTTPTQTPLDNSTKIASTAYTDTAISVAVGGGLTNTRLAKTALYTVVNADKGKTIALSGNALYTLTFNAASGYDANFAVTVTNEDSGRGKSIALNGGDTFILWPLQSIIVYNQNNVWQTIGRSRWKAPGGTTLNFYADFTNGTDTVGATDGLATGAAAFKSAERCFLNAADQIDFNAASQTIVKCNMAAHTADTQGMHSPVHAMMGAQGGAAFQIVGASLTISGCVSNGGLCKITVPSTTGYTTNDVVSVYGVSGATGANGTWKVTVTSSTELTLQGTTFGGTYTSGGTVTAGSSFNTTGVDCVDTYFGTVCQFYNITWTSTSNCLGALWGSKIYLQAGNIFGSCGGAHILIKHAGSQVHMAGDIGISATATNAFLQIQNKGYFMPEGAFNVNFVPGVNPSFSGLAFVYCDTQGQANFGGVTINTNGNTVSGTRFNANTGANITTGLQNGSLTYFPGNNAGSYGSGAAYDTLMSTTVAQGGTGLSSGTSGGIPYFSSTSTIASSAAFTAGLLIVGGGAGAAPVSLSNGQLPATATNDNATAGNVGEDIGSSLAAGSAVGLTSGTPANVTSISLTAGDWDVFGTIEYKGGATTTINFVQGGGSATSATLSEPNVFSLYQGGATPFGTITFIAFPIPTQRISVSGTTTVYLVANAGFGASTLSAYGRIEARRRR